MHLNNGLDIPPRNRDILETTILDILRTYNASMWLAGPGAGEGNYVDSLGAAPLTQVNALVGYADDKLSAEEGENLIANSEFVGATDVIPPNIWTGFGTSNGVVLSYAGGGTDEFGRYIDVRVLGTASATAFPVLHAVSPFSALNATAGEIISISGHHQIIGGSLTGLSLVSFRAQGLTSVGAFVEELAAANVTATRTSVRASRLLVGSTIAYIRPGYQFNVTSGATVDCTVRIWQMQANRGRLAPYLPTVGTSIARTKNHIPAYQATTGFKPQLLGGFLNYCAWSTDLSNAAWLANSGVKEPGNVYPELGRSVIFRENTTTALHYLDAASAGQILPINTICFVQAYFKPVGIDSRVSLQGRKNDGTTFPKVELNLNNNLVGPLSGGALGATIENSLYGFKKCTMWYDSGAGVSPPAILLCCSNGIVQAGRPAVALELAGGVIGIGTGFSGFPPVVQATSPQSSNSVPYSWRFDGVDDRFVVAKPTVGALTADQFRIVCAKLPAATLPGSLIYTAGCNAVAAMRSMQIFLNASSFNVSNAHTDDASVGGGTSAHLRQANERIVTTFRNTGGIRTFTCRGDLAAPSVPSTNAAVLAASVPTVERIGCNTPGGVGDTNFQPMDLYGVISGMGNPTAGEILALENFLAGCAGFTPLP